MLNRVKSFYGKILLTIMLCFVFPMSIVFLMGYHKLEQVMTDKIGELVESSVRQMENNLNELTDRVNRTSIYLSSDMRLNQLLRAYDQNLPSDAEFQYHSGLPEYMGKYEYLNLSVELQNILINYADNWLGDSIEMGIVANDGQLFSTWPEGNTDYENFDSVLKRGNKGRDTYYTNIHEGFIRYEQEGKSFTYVKTLYDIHSVDKCLGTLVVTVPMSVVRQIVVEYLEWQDYSICITDKEGRIIYTFEQENPDGFSDIDYVPAEAEKEIFQGSNGVKYLLRIVPVSGMAWQVCCAVSHDEVFKDALHVRTYVSGVCATLIVILAVITLIVIFRLFAPLRELKNAMQKVQSGDWEITALPVRTKDEIGQLTAGFNRLMQELKKMFEQEKESERQKGELKFEMLLAQINPHFLFNTLNSIKWMAAMIHADNITGMIRSLARLLEISMNRQADLISIEDELKNLNSYLEIQSVRYGDLFSTEYDLEDGIGEFQTLKLVFQPIVENAIIHNIQEVNPLKIEIEGRLDGLDVVFLIRDNGKGMEKTQVQALLKNQKTSEKSIFRGIGVHNVQQRIQMKYGEKYGIHIESEPGKGTAVSIRFPAVRYDNDIAEESLC